MEKPVYLDYNATTPIDSRVTEVMKPFLEKSFGNPSSNYILGKQSRDAVEKARKQVADLINCSPGEIVFTSGGTESNNHAIIGTAASFRHKGKHIITSAVEHPAVTEVCKYLNHLGFEISYVKVDNYGKVSLSDIEMAVRPDTILISVMHANNEVGTIQPVKEIAKIAKDNGIVFHTDASQSVGKIETDVRELGVDLLTIAGHKLYAPKGVGALYIREGLRITNLMHGAGQEKGLRPGTENVAWIAGLGKACEIANNDLSENRANMEKMRDRLFSGLKDKLEDRVKLNGSPDNRLPNTLSLAFKDIDAHALADAIKDDVLISTGSACHSGSTEISQVLKAMGVDLDTARGTVRISTGKYTTEEEVDFAVKVIVKAVEG